MTFRTNHVTEKVIFMRNCKFLVEVSVDEINPIDTEEAEFHYRNKQLLTMVLETSYAKRSNEKINKNRKFTVLLSFNCNCFERNLDEGVQRCIH